MCIVGCAVVGCCMLLSLACAVVGLVRCCLWLFVVACCVRLFGVVWLLRVACGFVVWCLVLLADG